MDDWARADQMALQKKQMMINISNENRRMAEKKRENEMASRVNRDVKEENTVANSYFTLQSGVVR